MHALVAWLTLAVTVQADAPGGSLGVLAVAPPPGPSAELVEVTLQLRQRLAEYHPGVLDARQLRERMTGQLPTATLAELDRAYEGARAAYVSGDHDGSVRTLRAILGELEKLPDAPEVFSQWTRAMLRLARSELNLGREEEARRVLERLVRAAPDVTVDRGLYPASFAQRVDAARAAAEGGPRRALAVLASVEGARVFVDGRDVGASPVRVAVAPGPHRVSAARGALRVSPVVVDVADEDQEVALDFSIPEALRPAAGPGLALADGDRSRLVVAAGALLRVDEILAVGLVEEGGATHVVGSLFDVRRGMLLREARVRLSNGNVPVGGIGALAEFLVTGEAHSGLVELPGEERAVSLAPALAPAASLPLAVDLPAVAAVARPSRAMGWASLGAGVAALGLAAFGIVESRSASGSYDRARQLRAAGIATNADVVAYNRLVADGDAARQRATFGWAAAGAGAVAMGVLGWINYSRTGEFGPWRF